MFGVLNMTRWRHTYISAFEYLCGIVSLCDNGADCLVEKTKTAIGLHDEKTNLGEKKKNTQCDLAWE